MQVSGVTGTFFSRLKAPVTSARTGAGEDVRSLKETARTATVTRSGQAGLLISTPPTGNQTSRPTSVLDTVNRSRFTEIRTGFFDTLKNRLQTLSDRVGDLLEAGDFTTRRADVSPRGFLDVDPGPNTPVSRQSLRPSRVAEGQVLSSNAQSQGALNLSGTFLINGISINVVATDGLSNIRDKINRGEDVNGNGTLDGPEDFNANGVADIIQIEPSEQGPGLFIVEDANGNGVLESGEDTNQNNRVDGGTRDNGVVAGLEQNRLTLTSQTGGASSISLGDPDDILLSLGFFELNAKGLSIQKEVQFDFDRPTPTNLNTAPQSAQLEIGGSIRQNDSNRFFNVIEDAVVELRRTSDRNIELEVVFDSDSANEQIQTLIQDFNTVISDINSASQGNSIFASDAAVSAVRRDLTERNGGDPSQNGDTRDEGVPNLFNRLTPPVSGQPLNDSGILNFGEFFISDSAQSIEGGSRNGSVQANELLSGLFEDSGLTVLADGQIEVDSSTLEQALRDNPNQLKELFFKEDTGLLPVLKERLDGLLRANFEQLGAEDNPAQTENNARNIEALFVQEPVRNLLAVI